MLIAPARPAQPDIPAASHTEAMPAEIPIETPAPASTDTPVPAPTKTPAPTPTETPTPTPTQTPALTPTAVPVLASTPSPPPREPLNPENAARVAQLARWGKGWVDEVAFSPDGRLLAVALLRSVCISTPPLT